MNKVIFVLKFFEKKIIIIMVIIWLSSSSLSSLLLLLFSTLCVLSVIINPTGRLKTYPKWTAGGAAFV